MLDFLDWVADQQWSINISLKITLDEAIFCPFAVSETALNPRSSDKLQYEGRGYPVRQYLGDLGMVFELKLAA